CARSRSRWHFDVW
nr:immunoglobulin heavy chain junction region [Mus musculus]